MKYTIAKQHIDGGNTKHDLLMNNISYKPSYM